jgi:dTDP-glucose 4,6-dehydratase
MDSSNILVTGGCGFIGSNFLNYMVTKYPNSNFYNIDKLYYCAREDNVKVIEYHNYNFIKGDINDQNFINYILKQFKIDVIIHFAAQSHVDNSFNNSLDFTRDNIMGTHTLLECAKEYNKLKLFLHISTDEVYGEVHLDHPGCLEETRLNPTNPYAATKAAAEMLVKSYYYSYKIPIIMTRSNNVYGPNQYPEKVIPKFALQLRNNKKMTIHGKGDTRRNFIHADDVARAVETIVNSGIIGDVYNIGTSQEFTVLEIAQKILERLKPGEKLEDWIEFVEDRPFNDYRYSVNPEKLKLLGWQDIEIFDKRLDELIYN